jgi:hypothetical protein
MPAMPPTLQRALLALLLLAPAAAAQTPGSSAQRFAWDQAAPTIADAQALTYRYYPDGAAAGVTFPAVTCAGAVSPFTCSAPIPAFTPGNHTIALTAANVAGESPKSGPFVFVFVVIPGAPVNVRIQ